MTGSRRSTARARYAASRRPELPSDPARLRAWGAVTLAYLAGLADGALEKAIEHAKSREQFGAPLAALPAVQAHLADAAMARDGLLLSAWSATDPGGGLPARLARLGGSACREVTAHVQQVHGGIGFALEGGVHRYYRRAKTVQVWTDALLRSVAIALTTCGRVAVTSAPADGRSSATAGKRSSHISRYGQLGVIVTHRRRTSGGGA